MKKASILSFQFADNYGAVLQIYALSKIIESKNIKVDVIDFSPVELSMPYSLGINVNKYIQNRGLLGTIKATLIKIKYYKRNKNRRINFKKFKDEFLNLTKEKYTTVAELSNSDKLINYHYYIVGSDQVWNPDFYKFAKEAYFLSFAPEKATKIAYAASIANKLNYENKSFFEKELKRFDYLSVREESAKKQISSLSEKEIEITLDPTLLLAKNDWRKLYNKSECKERYIFVYDLVMSPTIVELANKLSKKINAKIICYSNGKHYEDLLFSFDGINPKHFLQLIDEAEFVITSSFHGVAFSLAFEKQFYTVPHPTRGSRMIDLLTSVGLENLLIKQITEKDLELVEINYHEVNKKLKIMRDKSFDFLFNSLN